MWLNLNQPFQQMHGAVFLPRLLITFKGVGIRFDGKFILPNQHLKITLFSIYKEEKSYILCGFPLKRKMQTRLYKLQFLK